MLFNHLYNHLYETNKIDRDVKILVLGFLSICGMILCFALGGGIIGCSIAGWMMFSWAIQQIFMSRLPSNWVIQPYSLPRLFVMLLAWIEDAALSPFRALTYFLKDKTNLFAESIENETLGSRSTGKNLNDIINRNGAYGSLLGATAVAALTIGVVLLANPFTSLPLLGLMTAITTTIIVGALIAKTTEFIGRFLGSLQLKKLAENEITEAHKKEKAPINIVQTRAPKAIKSQTFSDIFRPENSLKEKVAATNIIKHSNINLLLEKDNKLGVSLENKLGATIFRNSIFSKSKVDLDERVENETIKHSFTAVTNLPTVLTDIVMSYK